jgi:hypothetical protein
MMDEIVANGLSAKRTAARLLGPDEDAFDAELMQAHREDGAI